MKIAVFGNYGVNNLGDDLMLQGVLKKIQDQNHEAVVFCGNPDLVRQKFGVPSHPFFPAGIRSVWRSIFSPLHKKSLREAMKALTTADEAYIGGGGILVDRFFTAILLWWKQLSVLEKHGLPYSFISNSFEMKRVFTPWIFKKYLKKAKTITVRDQASLDLLKKWGIVAEKEEDLSLCMLNAHDDCPKIDRTISLSLCQWELHHRHHRALRSFLYQKRQEGYRIVGLAFQTLHDDDRITLQKVDPNLTIIDDHDEILKNLRASELLIGMRYHALLLAHHFGVPAIALPYQEKVSNLARERGLAEIPIHTLSEEKLQATFEAVTKRGE